MLDSKKGQLGLLRTAGIAFIVIAITLSVGQQILGAMDDDLTADSYEKNATLDGEAGIDEISGWMATIGLVIAAAVILSVVGIFANRSQ